MTEFRINASEVAALVGKNPYKKQEEAITDCWNRNKNGLPPQESLRAQRVCAKNKDVDKAYNQMLSDIKSTESSDEVIQKKKEFSENIKKIVVGKVDDEISNTKNTFENDIANARTRDAKKKLEEDFSVKIEKLNHKKTQAREDAANVERDAISKFNTNYGTRKENMVASSYEEITGMNIEKPNKRYIWDILPGFKVVGKFDGFAEDGTLVEIKNRVRRLFGVVKEYESVQVHVYMKMCDASNAHLVEKFKDQLMVHEVHYDDDLMCDIEGELERVIKNNFC